MLSHYLEEQREAVAHTKALARMTAFELARLLAPIWGWKVEDEDDVSKPGACEHETFRKLPGGELECVACGARGY
jgi:hypothetical protein